MRVFRAGPRSGPGVDLMAALLCAAILLPGCAAAVSADPLPELEATGPVRQTIPLIERPAPAGTTYLPDEAPAFTKFHYGSLVNVNGTRSSEASYQILSRFALLVIKPARELSAAESDVALRLRQAGKRLYGYVHLATTLDPLTDQQIYAVIDECADAGYAGIFFDTAGYDYGVSRARLNAATDRAHERGLSVMANAWHPEHLLRAEVRELNPTGAPTRLGAGDWILLESFYQRSDDHYSGEFGGIASTMDGYVAAVTDAHALGVKVMGLAYHPRGKTFMDTTDRINSYNLALLLGLDGWSYGTSDPNNDRVPWSDNPAYSAGAGYLSDLRRGEGTPMWWGRWTDRGLIWFAAFDEPPARSTGIALLPPRARRPSQLQWLTFVDDVSAESAHR